MSEPPRQQMGDGSDNYGQAAGQIAKAAKQAGQEAAKQAAAKGVEATANAARLVSAICRKSVVCIRRKPLLISLLILRN